MWISRKDIASIIIMLFLAVLILICAGNAQASDRWQDHDSIYADVDHLAFSWVGYRDPQPIDAMRSRLFNWWGMNNPPKEVTLKEKLRQASDEAAHETDMELLTK
jgi:hypothetical protein